MKHKKTSKMSQIIKQNSDLELEGEYDDGDEAINMVISDTYESRKSDDIEDDCNLYIK